MLALAADVGELCNAELRSLPVTTNAHLFEAWVGEARGPVAVLALLEATKLDVHLQAALLLQKRGAEGE